MRSPGPRNTLTPGRWQAVQDVLAEIIDCPAQDRSALLDARCRHDAAMRREVESLLEAHERTGAVDRLADLVASAHVMRPEAATAWAGRRIGHYQVLDQLGAGGMGVVHTAEDHRLGRRVALKFLPPHLSANPDAKERFAVEARATAALEHPNICTIYEIGETDDGQLFIAMPLYEGETLQARIARGRLPFREAVAIAVQAARGLERAHAGGIVHRDVKPSNIMVLPDGTAKLLDFGIAKMHAATLTDRLGPIGTSAYMSPEQATGEPVDGRADIWSLGVVLHEMLTGKRPFRAAGHDGMALAIGTLDPDLTATSYPDVPTALDRVLRRALSRLPEHRYPSMALLASELAALAEHASSAERTDPSLGTPPAAVPMPVAERRRAAVLVTLVSDYMALVDQATPAETQRLVALVRDTAVDVVRRHGGLVNQAIGNEVVSLFGVPTTHDDDDRRAVRAALELHARISLIDQSSTTGPRLRVQSGLHVGSVVAQRLHEGPRRYDIIGQPAAIASRLASVALPGAVVVSPETQRLVAHYVTTTPCAPTVLNPDANAAPVTPFQVTGETGIETPLEASTRTGLTPYVGREAELALLEAHVVRARLGQGGVVAIVGEAGAGKSRLLLELQIRLAHDKEVRLLQARCPAYGEVVPYFPFVQIVTEALALSGSSAEASETIAAIRSLSPSLEPFLPLYLHLLSVQSDAYPLPRHLEGEHLQAALLDALGALVGVLSELTTLVVLIEDWHWADAASRAALARLAETTGQRAPVVMVTSRPNPSVLEEWTATGTRLPLERLGFEPSASIMQAALGVERVDDGLARRLYERTGGNPFFLEQICVALLEQQAIVVQHGTAIIEDRAEPWSLPDTVQAVIGSRLDNLDQDAREVARVAAVIGREFSHRLLDKIIGADVDLMPALDRLRASGLVQQTAAGPVVGYRFTHILTQEVCYESLVGHRRKSLHGLVGRAIEAQPAEGGEDRTARLAQHFGHAEQWAAAVRYGRAAADRAIALSQFDDALAMLDRVLGWAGRLSPEVDGDQTADLWLQQERLCETLGWRGRQQELINLLVTRLAARGPSARLAEVYQRQGDLSTLLKRFDAADRAINTALRIANELEEVAVARGALRSLGLLRWHEGRHVEALAIIERALDIDRTGHDDMAVAVDLTNLGNIFKAMGDHAAARDRLEQALAMPVLVRDPRKLVYTLHNLANVHRALGDLEEALACLHRADEIARQHLLPIQRSFHLTSIAHILLQQGHVDTAIETYEEAIQLSRRARHADGLVQSLRMLGELLDGLDRHDEALPFLQEAAQLFAQLEDRAAEAEMWSRVAHITEARQASHATEAWQRVLSLQRERGDRKGELEAQEGLARALRKHGASPGEAIAAFATALDLAMTLSDPDKAAALRNVLGILEWARGGYFEALRHYEAALVLFRNGGDRPHECLILNSLGVTLTRLGRPEEARTALEDSLALARDLGERQLEAHALAALGHVCLGRAEADRASQYFQQSLAIRRTLGDRAGEAWMQVRLAEVATAAGDDAAARQAVAAARSLAAQTGDAAVASACARLVLDGGDTSPGE